MNCKVTFTVNGEEISLDLETGLDSPLTDQDIIKVLRDNPEQRQALCDIIHTKLYNQSSIGEVTVKSLTSKKGLLGNCGVGYLMEQFSDIEFPAGVEANVLLVDNLKIGNQSIYGRVINSDGKEIFVVSGKKDKNGKAADVAKLANFLTVRQLLETQSFRFSEKSPEYENLQKILTERNKKKDKVENVFELMLDFMYNKDKYQSMYITTKEGAKESVYNILQKLVKTIKSKSIQAKYGIEYETIQSFDIIEDNYKGYKIYAFFDEGVKKFIPSRTFLTEKTVTKIYDSEKEARSYIDSAVEKQDIKKHSFRDFKFRGKTVINGRAIYEDELSSFTVYSQQSLTQGSIIESLDIPIVSSTRFYNGENILFLEDRQNFSSFKKIVEGWNISDGLKQNIYQSINNAEKIATFIYKVNELLKDKRNDETAIRDIVQMIEDAPRRAYYIESKNWVAGKGQFIYRVIPTNPIQIEQYKKSKRTPIISLMSAIDKVIADKFGVQVNMQTSEEIKTNFPDIDANTSKAFIRDGEIFINTTIASSSDLLHEYTHLILGVLKSDPNLRRNYEQLLDIVARTREGRNTIKSLRSRYDTASEMDLMEEAFVKLFSNYVVGKMNPNLEQVFVGQEKFLKDATKIVFNNEIADLKSFYGKSIETVFTRFSSDVSALLNQPGLDFGSTRTSRMYSNWISKQVKLFRDTEGKDGINEQCYG